MSIRKSVVATIIVLAVIVIAAYGLFSLGGGNTRGGNESGFRSLNVRTYVTLVVVGGVRVHNRLRSKGRRRPGGGHT